jgi:hypothetical protein
MCERKESSAKRTLKLQPMSSCIAPLSPPTHNYARCTNNALGSHYTPAIDSSVRRPLGTLFAQSLFGRFELNN